MTHSAAGPLAQSAWMPAQGALHETIPLTAEELVSLQRVSMGIDRMAILAAHIDKLHDGGYVREGRMGLVLTDLGRLRLKFEKGRLDARSRSEGHGTARLSLCHSQRQGIDTALPLARA